jgi:hypothetical protein
MGQVDAVESVQALRLLDLNQMGSPEGWDVANLPPIDVHGGPFGTQNAALCIGRWGNPPSDHVNFADSPVHCGVRHQRRFER